MARRGKYRPHRVARRVLAAALGITVDQARAAVLALDAAGLIIMPRVPTVSMLNASLHILRQERALMLPGANKDELQRYKHTIRYQAMVDDVRRNYLQPAAPASSASDA